MFFSLAIHPQQPLQDWNIQYKFVGLPTKCLIELLVRSKIAITLEVKPYLSNFNRGIERQKESSQGIILIFTCPVNFFNTLFFTDFRQFSKRG